MVKAREIKVDQITRKARERVEGAEISAMKKAIKGESTSQEDIIVAIFRGRPRPTGIALINDAATPEELSVITEDDVFA
jgi:hypothetical protein